MAGIFDRILSLMRIGGIAAGLIVATVLGVRGDSELIAIGIGSAIAGIVEVGSWLLFMISREDAFVDSDMAWEVLPSAPDNVPRPAPESDPWAGEYLQLEPGAPRILDRVVSK